MTEQRVDGLLNLIPVTLFLTVTLFVYIPNTIYTNNLDEFISGYLELTKHYVAPFIVLNLCFIAPVLLLGMKTLQRYTVVILLVGVLIWVQANLLTFSYGEIDGRRLDFDSNAWRSLYELPLWFGIVGGGLYIWRYLYPQARTIATVFILLQFAVMVFSPGTFRTIVKDDSVVGKKFYEFSGNRDVLHIILDDFGSITFRTILDQEPELKHEFDGFTFFSDATGLFTSTHPSIDSIMTGNIFGFDEPFRNYLRRQLGSRTFDIDLQENGYDAQIVTKAGLCRMFKSPCKSAHHIAGNFVQPRNQALQLLDMSLYRASTHLLKQAIYRDGEWTLRSYFSENETTLQSTTYRYAYFYDQFIESMELREGKAQSVYRLLHLMIPHPPYILNRECELIDRQKDNFASNLEQAKCTIKKTVTLFAKLKQLGLYDSTLIVIHADHGSHYEVRERWDRSDDGPSEWFASRSSTLLLLKPSGARGSMIDSLAPASLVDVRTTILDLVGIVDLEDPGFGVSLVRLREGENRKRYHWANSVWNNESINPVDARLYAIEGNHLDPKSWKFLGYSEDIGKAPDRVFGRESE